MLGLIIFAATATLAEPHLPMPVRQQYRKFSYTYLSVAPANGEKYGVYQGVPFGPDDEIWVALGDGGERHVYGMRPGGDDFRHATLEKSFNLRVNAPNSEEAARMLAEYLEARGFKGSIRGVCIFGHGDSGAPLLGVSAVGKRLLTFLSSKRPGSGFADLYFVNCNVAEGVGGRAYIHGVADEHELRVSASEDTIGWNVFIRPVEGRANYALDKESWLTATPHERELKRTVWPSGN
ncbi:MAG: hypothetical protein ABW208_29440 [Pyrinomonadaceae bacterium]